MELLAITQGFYFLVTGIWPLVSIGTFQLVTGPKTDLWLVKTVGVLIGVTGSVLMVAGFRGNVSPEIFLLATGSSVALIVVDVNFVSKGVISRVYLLDAVAETVLVILWMIAMFS